MNGNENEFNFVKAFNRKIVSDLDPLKKELIMDLFNNVSETDEIRSWKNHYKQKSDVFIKIGVVTKRISIKLGARNSVHLEHIDSFISFLKDNHVPQRAINIFLGYLYADGTINNTGLHRISAEEYRNSHKRDLIYLNKCFSDPQLIIKVANRFVIKGLVYNDNIDALVYGTPNDFLYIKQKDIFEIIFRNADLFILSPHFGPLVCQSMHRCLNRNEKYEYCRNYVQIKWYSLIDDIIQQKYISHLFL